MNLKHRVDKLSEQETARQREAWEPLVQYMIPTLRRAEWDAYFDFRARPREEQVERAAALPSWGGADQIAAWNDWIMAWAKTLEAAGERPWPMIYPEQAPEPPEEPEGAFEHLRRLCSGGEHAGAAAEGLYYFTLARAVRRHVR